MLTFGLVVLNLFFSHVHGCYKISKPPIYDKKSDSSDCSYFNVSTESPGYYVTQLFRGIHFANCFILAKMRLQHSLYEHNQEKL